MYIAIGMKRQLQGCKDIGDNSESLILTGCFTAAAKMCFSEEAELVVKSDRDYSFKCETMHHLACHLQSVESAINADRIHSTFINTLHYTIHIVRHTHYTLYTIHFISYTISMQICLS